MPAAAASKRLEIIARIVRDRGFYALQPADAEAIETVLSLLAQHEPAPAPDDEFTEFVRAVARAGWRITRA